MQNHIKNASDEGYNADKTFDRFVTVPGRIYLNHCSSRPVDN